MYIVHSSKCDMYFLHNTVITTVRQQASMCTQNISGIEHTHMVMTFSGEAVF